VTGPFVVGIDLSSKQIDFAYVNENEDKAHWSRCILDGRTAWERTLSLGNIVNDALTWDQVYLVAIEAPYGRGQAGTNAILNRVVGAIAGNLPASLRRAERCWIARPDEWKRGLGLKAKPTRDDVQRLLQPAYPWEQIPDDQNALDAACIALWARNENARGIAAALNPPKGQAA
jgi:hypothetical protein